LKTVNLQTLDTIISFDVVSPFTNVPVDEVLEVIRNKLHNDNTRESKKLSALLFFQFIYTKVGVEQVRYFST
jgi:hypothetical protein